MCKERKKIAGLFLLALFFLAGITSAQETTAAEIDTFFVFGNHSFGVINLPPTPKGIPYLINDNIEMDNKRIVLLAGEHKIHWSGGIEYESIDTVIEIGVGEIRDIAFNFVERKATLFLEAEPEEAKIFLDGELAGVGVLFRSLKAGEHKITVSAKGYRTSQQELTMLPNRLVRMNVELEKSVEGDIYFNKKGKELRKLGNFWWNHLNNQPFSIEVAAISVQYRIAADKNFRNLISLFNDGAPIGTNYRGLSFFNKLWIAKSFWIASVEYGQGFGGLKYEKKYPIAVDDYFLIYKDYREKNPEMGIRSYSGQLGIRAENKNVSLAILTGYARETITVDGISKKTADGKEYFTSFSKRNDGWLTTVRTAVSPRGESLTPSFFAEISFTSRNGYDVSGWTNLRSGILIPWRFDKSNKN